MISSHPKLLISKKARPLSPSLNAHQTGVKGDIEKAMAMNVPNGNC